MLPWRGGWTVGGPHYVRWGFISITVPNLVVLGLMIIVFAVALMLRLPDEHGGDGPGKERQP